MKEQPKKQPENHKIDIAGSIVLIILGLTVFAAFVLLMWNIYTAICHA